MTKNEFLESLRAALNGKVASNLVTENLRYYEDYINTEIRKGKTEAEVLSSLGDPRLIARTIVETKGGSSRSEEYGESSRTYDGDTEYDIHRQAGNMPPGLFFRLPIWVWLLIVLVIIIVILSVIFSVISALLPILLPILAVLFLVKLFRDWIH